MLLMILAIGGIVQPPSGWTPPPLQQWTKCVKDPEREAKDYLRRNEGEATLKAMTPRIQNTEAGVVVRYVWPEAPPGSVRIGNSYLQVTYDRATCRFAFYADQ